MSDQWEWLKNLLGIKEEVPPPIMTPYGPQTEWIRAVAARNMRNDPAIKERVERIFIQRCEGDVVKGIEESKKAYPEAYS